MVLSRPIRMFEIIQLLRWSVRPLSGQAIADELEVSKRTIYRDIASLQSMRVPIIGEPGIGYVLRKGFDLPPLMFSADEVEAIVVGLSLIKRTGDVGLQRAAESVAAKIGEVLPDDLGTALPEKLLYTSSWSPIVKAAAQPSVFRAAIREAKIVQIDYVDVNERHTRRQLLPIGLIYYIHSIVVVAWCELRSDFRHFRLDRIVSCEVSDHDFSYRAKSLRADWKARQGVG